MIEFKGEIRTIPAGAALVLNVDRHLAQEQADAIRAHCCRQLGEDVRVLVLGPGITAQGLVQLPAEPSGETIVNRIGDADRERIWEGIVRGAEDPNSRVVAAMRHHFVNRNQKPLAGYHPVGLGHNDEAPQGQDPMEAVRSMSKG